MTHTTRSKPLDARTMRWREIRRLNKEQRLDAAGMYWQPLDPLSDPYLCSLEQAGLEEDDSRTPVFGLDDHSAGVVECVSWLTDGEDSRYETN